MDIEKIKTIGDIRRANDDAGYFYFSPETMDFFSSRVYPELYKDVEENKIYFVTSEKDGMTATAKRRYSVRVFDVATSDVETVGEYGGYDDLEDAQEAAMICAGMEVEES